MKHLTSCARYLLTVGTISMLCAFKGQAGEPTSLTEATAQAAAAADNKLPYGVEDVLKLSRGRVTDDVILTYIQTSGTVYNVRANDILYLRGQGVSDRVITAMLDQRRKPAEDAGQADPSAQVAQGNGASAAGQATPAPVPNTETPLFIPGQNAFEMAAFSQPVPTEQGGPSTLYVIPYGSSPVYQPVYTFYPGCSYRPYYGGCYASCGYRSYCAPSTVVRIGGGYHHSYSFHRR